VTQEKRLQEASRGARFIGNMGALLSGAGLGNGAEDYSSYGTAWDYLPHDIPL